MYNRIIAAHMMNSKQTRTCMTFTRHVNLKHFTSVDGPFLHNVFIRVAHDGWQASVQKQQSQLDQLR